MNDLPTAAQLLTYFETHLDSIIMSPAAAKRRLARETADCVFKEWYREFYLQSRHWGEIRLLKLAANSACEGCGDSEFVPHVHHLQYRNIYDVQLGDLRVLCGDCHGLQHPKKD